MEKQKPSIFRRFLNVIKQVTVEPVVFITLSGSLLASTATQTLALEKACRVNLNFSEEACDALRNQNTDDNSETERLVQEYVAVLISYKSILTSVLPCLLLIFTGGWMDLTGRRKIIMLLAVFGEMLVQTNNIINVVFFYQLKVEFLVLFEGLFHGMFGCWSLLFLGAFSYIMDITTAENRTWRVGLVNLAVFIGIPVGSSLSGVVLKNFGYLAVYATSIILASMNALYVIFILSDPKRTKEHKSHDNRGFCYFLKTFFNPIHFLDSLKVLVKKTPDNRAIRLFIMLAAVCLLFGPMYGETAVMYMSTRYRFGWDELQFSIFQGYNSIITMIGTIFCVIVVSKIFGCHDSVLGIMSTVSKICGSMVYAFATTGTIFYLGPLLDIFNGNAFLAMRAIFSKNVEPHEIAKLNSIVGIFEVGMPLVYVPMYIRVYTASMESIPGLVFLLGTILTIPPFLVFIWLLFRHRRAVQLEKLQETSPEQSRSTLHA